MRYIFLLAALICTQSNASDEIIITSLTTDNTTREAFSQPLPQLPAALRDAFFRGRALFRQNWVIAPSRDELVDGLGPLHNRISCIACHTANGKGHAPDQANERASALLVRLSVPGKNLEGGPRPHPVYGDQLNEDSIPGVPAEGRVRMTWESEQITLTGSRVATPERVTLRRPVIHFSNLAYGSLKGAQTSARIGPAVFGLGLLEAISNETLQHQEKNKSKGRLNYVFDTQSQLTVIGRFGLKANRSTLRDQIAGAMNGDLGITSTLMPHSNCTVAQTQCLNTPDGGKPELTDNQLDDLEIYLSYLAPPAPRNQTDVVVTKGRQVFNDFGCGSCHRPSMPLGKHARLGDLSGQEIHPYTDLMLHDMGPKLADGRPDYQATSREWRTPPLWGAGLLRQVNERTGYLHDGRARNVEEAILWHGGEAASAQQRYRLSHPADRKALLSFINSL